MPVPRLLRPALLVVEAIEKGTTVYDDDYREPIGDPDRTEYRIMAQRSNVHRQMPAFEQAGVNEQVRGWFTIRIRDAEALGWTPRRGDRFVKFGRHGIELYAVNPEPIGHWEKGATLLRIYFSDRRPAAVEPDKG